MDRTYDAVVIGGGLLGCFAARALCRRRLRVALVEQREDVCTGISRANTAIVYAGYDTKPGTLKSRLTVQANREFDGLCRELGVRFRRCGSLMVAFGPRGRESLRRKLEQGAVNGVEGLRLLDRAEALALEPALSPAVEAALWCPGVGTVDPWELCLAAAENADYLGLCRSAALLAPWHKADLLGAELGDLTLTARVEAVIQRGYHADG